MIYLSRHAEETVTTLSKMFKSILVVGARQVGRTTMLKKITKDINYITLDDPIMLRSAKEQSLTFFKDNPPPIFIDEIQRAGELFINIKMLIDSSKKKGQFYMCGSQPFSMIKGVSESLAGRIGLITLLGLTLREINKVEFNNPFIPNDEYLNERRKTAVNISYDDVWFLIHRGSMLELCLNPDFKWDLFYSSYVRTYLEKDVRDVTHISDEVKFMKFMQGIASVTGNLLNLQSIARDIGITHPTASRWLSILVSSNIVYLLKPYSNNFTSRAI